MSYFKDHLLQDLKPYVISHIKPNKINAEELNSCITTIENFPEKTLVFPVGGLAVKIYDDSLINDLSHLNNLVRMKQVIWKI
jgi:hypothetical protein